MYNQVKPRNTKWGWGYYYWNRLTHPKRQGKWGARGAALPLIFHVAFTGTPSHFQVKFVRRDTGGSCKVFGMVFFKDSIKWQIQCCLTKDMPVNKELLMAFNVIDFQSKFSTPCTWPLTGQIMFGDRRRNITYDVIVECVRLTSEFINQWDFVVEF